MDKVVHFHIPVDDMERARRCYMNIFGWDFQGTGYPEYQLATTVDTDENDIPKEPGAINGALYTRYSESSLLISPLAYLFFMTSRADSSTLFAPGRIPYCG